MGKPKVGTQPVPNYLLHEDIVGISQRPSDFLPKQGLGKRPLKPLKMESKAKIL
jgi:hypothetical protein